jgi:hypothetical protein
MSPDNPFNRHHSGDQGPPSFDQPAIDPEITEIVPAPPKPDLPKTEKPKPIPEEPAPVSIGTEEETKVVPAEPLFPQAEPKAEEPLDLDPPLVPPTPRVSLTPDQPEVVEKSRNWDPPSWLPWVATALALLALLVAVFTGGSGSVAPSAIEDGSITGAKVAEGSIGPEDLSDQAQEILRGATGPAGPAGKPGARVVGSVEIRTVETTSVPSAAVERRGVAQCRSDEKLVGGGANVTGGEDVFISTSGPSIDDDGNSTGWRAAAESLSVNNKEWILSVVALCSKEGQ